MAEQPQEFPPVQPTETFKPLNYTPPPQQAIPTQEIPNTYIGSQPAQSASVYTPVQPAYTAPVQKKRRGGPLVWILGGCGVIAVLGFIFIAVITKNVMDQVGKSDLLKNKAAIPTAKRDLVEIRAALDKYTQAHQGKYPASLSDIVDSSYLSYAGNNGAVKVEYTRPTEDAASDTPVAGYYVGEMSMSFGQTVRQRTYLRLLKDGTVVQEQVTRVPLQNY